MALTTWLQRAVGRLPTIILRCIGILRFILRCIGILRSILRCIGILRSILRCTGILRSILGCMYPTIYTARYAVCSILRFILPAGYDFGPIHGDIGTCLPPWMEVSGIFACRPVRVALSTQLAFVLYCIQQILYTV
jgi:hypothetical protein